MKYLENGGHLALRIPYFVAGKKKGHKNISSGMSSDSKNLYHKPGICPHFFYQDDLPNLSFVPLAINQSGNALHTEFMTKEKMNSNTVLRFICGNNIIYMGSCATRLSCKLGLCIIFFKKKSGTSNSATIY